MTMAPHPNAVPSKIADTSRPSNVLNGLSDLSINECIALYNAFEHAENAYLCGMNQPRGMGKALIFLETEWKRCHAAKDEIAKELSARLPGIGHEDADRLIFLAICYLNNENPGRAISYIAQMIDDDFSGARNVLNGER